MHVILVIGVFFIVVLNIFSKSKCQNNEKGFLINNSGFFSILFSILKVQGEEDSIVAERIVGGNVATDNDFAYLVSTFKKE